MEAIADVVVEFLTSEILIFPGIVFAGLSLMGAIQYRGFLARIGVFTMFMSIFLGVPLCFLVAAQFIGWLVIPAGVAAGFGIISIASRR